jgi:hypothetical protein
MCRIQQSRKCFTQRRLPMWRPCDPMDLPSHLPCSLCGMEPLSNSRMPPIARNSSIFNGIRMSRCRSPMRMIPLPMPSFAAWWSGLKRTPEVPSMRHWRNAMVRPGAIPAIRGRVYRLDEAPLQESGKCRGNIQLAALRQTCQVRYSAPPIE